MNSCRRGLADRTWSVTRLLWRDRYTLSCLDNDKYTQCRAANPQPGINPLISSVSFVLSHWVVSITASLCYLHFLRMRVVNFK